MTDRVSLLKSVLHGGKINHKQCIKMCETVKDAHIYCKLNKLPGQISGNLLETFISDFCNMTKNNSSECKGYLFRDGKNYEIKTSLGGKECNKFNFVQLRMHHDCEYIFTAYYVCDENVANCGELFMFKMDKESIKQLICKYGSYAHGTKTKNGDISMCDLECPNNMKEYCLRPKYGDKLWNDLLTYRIDITEWTNIQCN